MRSLRLLRCRPFSTRFLILSFLALAFGIYCYYYTVTPASYPKPSNNNINSDNSVSLKHVREPQSVKLEQCPVVRSSQAEIDTVSIFPTFDFQPNWLRTKEFWDRTFEERYEKIKNDSRRPRLKVFVVPHSHNDPGWLNTFEQYFETKTKNILNNIVTKLNQYPNMTFIWTEISFLNAWWERSHPVKQKAFKKLVKEGRVEITTGGWVMPDEACTHIYSLIDQFIEGHVWVKANLGVTPKVGWSIDPFGHGATVPYLLDKSGLEGAIIQRIHYAWKQWFAQKQIEEFYWMPGFSSNKPSLVIHNQPFDIYSIKSTCGPHPAICLSFDFRKIPGEYSEYTAKHEDITEQNLHSKSKTLMEEYDRIGSLTTHNVVLVPLGDDFRYDYGIEFDAQYVNYMKMFNYINKHKEIFDADVSFGTPVDYFNAVKERHGSIPTLRGDFFVYSDIFSEGKPAYWSGYYTTRPYIKIVARQFEHHLRAAEILFTLVSNFLRQSNKHMFESSERKLEKYYEQLITARRNLGLFQHHDAITGTSKASVMYDYGTKLFTSIYHCIRLQEAALTTLMIPDSKLHTQSILQSELEWETYGKQPRKMLVTVVDKKKVILFNPLAEQRTEVITLRSNTTNVRVYDTHNEKYVQYQITPNIDIRDNGKFAISDINFDVMFVATLEGFSVMTYNLEEYTNHSQHCVVFCNNCTEQKSDPDRANNFVIKKMMPGNIQLENEVMKLLVDRNTGFLRQVYRKDIRKKNIVDIQFGAYQSAQRHSGAYLFMPDYDPPEKDVLGQYTKPNNMQDENVIIVSGPISTEITTMYLPFLVHTLRIYNVDDHALSHGIYMETIVDYESPPKNRDTELYMRIQTNLQNGEVPEFYTDQNGFQYQRRVKVDKLGIEANYYPITTMAWIQDDETRMTLITNHAQGAAAFEPGRLEVMMDRRTLYDDFRGIGEGVVDNKPTVFTNWLLLEPINTKRAKRDTHRQGTGPFQKRRFNTEQKAPVYELPSQTADYLSRTLNYPVNAYVVDTSEVGEIEVKEHQSFLTNFPSGIHVVSMRTITDEVLEQFPSNSCFMVLHRPGFSCDVGNTSPQTNSRFTTETKFNGLIVNNLVSVSLTGLKTYKNLSSLANITLEPMEVKTYRVRF
ncbi:alpha-mannosidase 2 [Colias croceus]|uniref:alpha-mannosidase 2 n=1 Tax=Colias crocea TaxID=72248 RepID=UPI001E281297|nr:alpha-mannosidase 2 [Colias croceus]